MKNKRPASRNIGVDPDRAVIDRFSEWSLKEKVYLELGHGSISTWIFSLGEIDKPTTFIYSDPPYLMETRKSGHLYRYEYTERQHVQLLKLLLSLKAMVMISGYRHAIYDDALSSWRRIDYQAMTRQGLVWESAWMNYPEPIELHDYRYLGANYRERERIQRKAKRWVNKLKAMSVLEQQALLAAMNNAINT